MILNRGVRIVQLLRKSLNADVSSTTTRMATTSPSGAILPEPRKPRFGYLGVICAVSTGLFIGANLSKNIANFLEENELFVPSDDDDDD
ncbi:unnamed protein product [Trichogramma brassicae]|uniref:Essential MCU regulator, mitochondrial n=1 Tax=Trichogramma brassicae TaxID=86971 RepID=A0A6H5J208_9HYME|nr:unnamed protein product [Trichogramma brassicae]